MSSVDTRSNTSLFTVLLVTDAAATCQAFTLQVAGETFCLPEAQAIAALLQRRPADLVVLAASPDTGAQIQQALDGRHNLVALDAAGEASVSVRVALDSGDPGALLRALAQAVCLAAGAAVRPAEPVLPPPNGDGAAPAQTQQPPPPAPAAEAPSEEPPQQAPEPQAAGAEPAGPGHSASRLEMEDRLERVLNRRLGP